MVSYSKHHIKGEIWQNGTIAIVFIAFYGWPSRGDKWKSWDLLRTLLEGMNHPTVVGGDFKEILTNNEKEGGPPRSMEDMRSFCDALNDCSLSEVKARGPWFIWERGGMHGELLREKLDRFVGNKKLFDTFKYLYAECLARYKSDHSTILLKLRKKAPYIGQLGHAKKLEKYWFEHQECDEVVRGGWSTGLEMDLSARLRGVTRSLSSWSTKIFLDFTEEISKIETLLKNLQQEAGRDDYVVKCIALEAQLEDLYKQRESLWFWRYRVAEVKDGDKNTAYFQHKARQRKQRNTIAGLLDHNDVWCTEDKDIIHIVTDYYHNLFATQGRRNFDDMLSCIP